MQAVCTHQAQAIAFWFDAIIPDNDGQESVVSNSIPLQRASFVNYTGIEVKTPPPKYQLS